MKINVIYGSTMGNTKSAAEQIAALTDGKVIAIADATAEDFDADLLILGTSTWGSGDLQDDWAASLNKLSSATLTGRKVACFGEGDQAGYASTFEDGMAILAETATAAGATLIGDTASDGYSATSSRAVRDGRFVGLALDGTNEPDKTDLRIANWCETLKATLTL